MPSIVLLGRGGGWCWVGGGKQSIYIYTRIYILLKQHDSLYVFRRTRTDIQTKLSVKETFMFVFDDALFT